MPALSEVTKIVNDTVPAFFGTDGPDLHAEVSRFVQGCKMVESELLTGENNGLVQMVIQCLKLRLMGSAYSKIAQLQYGSVDALCNAIKKHYLKRRSTDKLRELITTCKQSIKEPASKFGERLDALLSESLSVIEEEWPAGPGREAIVKDFRRITTRSFLKGLRDHAMKARFMGQEHEDLIKIVENAEEIFEEPTHSINTMASAVPCRFCNKMGHEWNSCRDRLNTPYCNNCGEYGHEVGPRCKSTVKNNNICTFCRNKGHTRKTAEKTEYPILQNLQIKRPHRKRILQATTKQTAHPEPD
ncbi:hypothetical protein EVAR_70446_1 [Eumeta japonica]|uniref:CCHC-type domain-containing protein n=1 Tax=Eumeta variegata TaxID=151549 RepID=A0A4C1TT35_EUMVA|nr:hypothetical protein EVAR_70446_1 [Eumeta japonica]